MAVGDESGGMVGASGTKYRPRQRVRVSTPGARPLRSGGGDGGGGMRHMRADKEYQ